MRLLPDRRGTVAVLAGEPALRLYWQRPILATLGARTGSRYHQILQAAGLPPSSLRPDFLLATRELDRVLVIEVKHTTRTDTRPDREGILDALAYLYEAQSLLADLPDPRALVVAWAPQPSRMPTLR